MTYVMEGWLKGMMEEANKEKVLNQVAEASLNEKKSGVECSRALNNHCENGSGASRAES